MANTRVSDLGSASALSGTDLFYVVQTAGVGGVKATGAQFEEFIEDVVAGALVGGSNISVSYNDPAGTITITYTGATPPATTDDLTEGVTNLYYTDARVTAVVAPLIREKLTAARTYYVRTDGSDSNTGLTDSAGGAFLTWQKAVDVAASLDTVVYDVTIRWGAETPTKTFDVGLGIVAKSAVGAGKIILVGNDTTPADVELVGSGTSVDPNNEGILVADALTTIYRITGFTLKNNRTSANPVGLLAKGGSKVEFGALDFAAGAVSWGQQIRGADFGLLQAISNYTVSAGGLTHCSVQSGQIRVQARTVTLAGSPAFSTAFFTVSDAGNMYANSNTYSGSASAGTKQYDLSLNGTMRTNGAFASIPGGVAGTTATGGQFN